MVRFMRERVRWVWKWAVEVGGRGGWISRGWGEGFEDVGGEEEKGLGALGAAFW